MRESAAGQDDGEFLARFESAAIPSGDWNHEAHLRMAYLYLRARAFPDALRRIRSGIQRLNRAHGVRDTDASGYHETLTLTWARLVGAALASPDAAADFEAFIAEHPELLARDRVLQHYSRERITTPRARREFVLPDRAPLPNVETSSGPAAD